MYLVLSLCYSHTKQAGQSKMTNRDSEVKGQRLHLRAQNEKCFRYAVCLQQDEGGVHLKKEPIRIVFHGDPAPIQFSDEEQRIFYGALLTRILDLYRQEKEQKQQEGK